MKYMEDTDVSKVQELVNEIQNILNKYPVVDEANTVAASPMKKMRAATHNMTNWSKLLNIDVLQF